MPHLDRHRRTAGTHPLNCHRPRIPDTVVFDHLIAALVLGAGYERIADKALSATALRRRWDECIHAGLFVQQAALTVAAMNAVTGLDLSTSLSTEASQAAC